MDRGTGKVTYVNAGHNPALLCADGSTAALDATGLPLGLSPNATYEVRTLELARGGSLLLFTDGLPDSIPGEDPEARSREVLAGKQVRSLYRIMTLVDPKLSEDDISVWLVRPGD